MANEVGNSLSLISNDLKKKKELLSVMSVE